MAATVSFVGRDGTVRVQSAADADRALAIVRDVTGVRVARVVVPSAAGAMPPSAPSPAPTVSLTITSSPGSATITPSSPAASMPPSPSTTSPAPTTAPSATASPTPAPAPSTSSTPLAEVQSQLNALPKITFPTNSSTLTERDVSIVKQLAAILRAQPGVRIRIQGDTDSAGPAAYNLALSRTRASAVFTALRADGIPAARMTAVGYGETKPKVPNTNATNRAINRRVDVVASE